ncbi:class I SAM-dependent methyltransferase [Ammonicoccus fulvus]|uniref:Class I SAM-dependent methyltransferase n=1 Tax=Ammonicoccus fulvus TaxID=3138240 RepID=A0ABZ3FVY2_9ACTN
MIEAKGVVDGHNVAEPSWLALRSTADERAREAALPLVKSLAERLAPGPAHGIDIGTGTGANHAYLSARLGVPVRWTVLDHDADLLGHAAHRNATGLLAEIADLPVLIGDGTPGTFLTCSAVLDVVGEADLDALAAVLVTRRLPALFSLSVTGEVVIGPEDPLDGSIAEAFNAHQRRGARPGPDAPRRLAERLPVGWLTEVRTHWLLGARDDASLLEGYLRERAAVAVESDPELAGPVNQWLERRMTELAAGCLTVEVGHVDQLVLPA